MNPQYAEDHLPLILGVLQGKLSGSEFLTGSGQTEQPFVISEGKRKKAFIWNWKEDQWELNDAAFAKGSIAVIPVIGPVMKYNGSCGEPGMVRRQSWMDEIMSSDKIIGKISIIDSPGGQADGTPEYADHVKSLSKPTVALINGGAYSAGAWIASGHDKIYAANKYAAIGSIGAYTSILDFEGYFLQQGIRKTDIYPEVSKDKNIAYRNAIKGNTKLMTENVTQLALSFISAFAENRGDRLNSNEWDTGKEFNAEYAHQIGMIDGIKSLEEIANEMTGTKVFALNSSKSTNTQSTTTNMNFPNVTALAGVQNATQAQLDQANADLTTAGITGCTIVNESFITEAASVTTQKETLTASVADLTTQLTAANTAKATAEANLATANTKITDLEAKVEAFGKNAGAKQKTAVGADTPPEQSDEDDSFLNSLAHNRTADRLLG